MSNGTNALRQLADWLDKNELPEDASVDADGISLYPSLAFHAHGASEALLGMLGGEWEATRSMGVTWWNRNEGMLGFHEVTVFA